MHRTWMRAVKCAVVAMTLAGCAGSPVLFATETRTTRAHADAQCEALDARVARIDRVDDVLAACRDAGETGPCWVALSSAEADYAITIDGHLWAVPIGVGEAIAICEVR